MLLKYGSILCVLLVGWYTINIARVAWAEGNRAGAVAAAALATVATGLPLAVILFGNA